VTPNTEKRMGGDTNRGGEAILELVVAANLLPGWTVERYAGAEQVQGFLAVGEKGTMSTRDNRFTPAAHRSGFEACQARTNQKAARISSDHRRAASGRRNVAAGHRCGARRAGDSDRGRRSLASLAGGAAAGADTG
jgi:hypothetical protein